MQLFIVEIFQGSDCFDCELEFNVYRFAKSFSFNLQGQPCSYPVLVYYHTWFCKVARPLYYDLRCHLILSVVWRLFAFFCFFFLHLFFQIIMEEMMMKITPNSMRCTRLKLKLSSWKFNSPTFRLVS